jgi:hypothetical protein
MFAECSYAGGFVVNMGLRFGVRKPCVRLPSVEPGSIEDWHYSGQGWA